MSAPKAACCGGKIGTINDRSSPSEQRRIQRHQRRCSGSVFHQHWFSIRCTVCGKSV